MNIVPPNYQAGDATGSARVLLTTLFFLLGKNFSLSIGKEHRALTFGQLRLAHDRCNQRAKLVNNSYGEKNRTHVGKCVEHHASLRDESRCLVKLYEKYISKCPLMGDDEPFSLTPERKVKDDNIWNTKIPLGHNTLGNVVKNLCRDAGIEGHFTTHSLRVTTAVISHGLEKRIPTKLLQERTGHRSSESFLRYQRTSESVKRKVSEMLNGECESMDDSFWE